MLINLIDTIEHPEYQNSSPRKFLPCLFVRELTSSGINGHEAVVQFLIEKKLASEGGQG